MPSSTFANVCLLLLVLLPTSVTSSSTEYKCPSGEHCTISSNESICTPIGQGLPAGNLFMPTLMGSGASSEMPYACVGISTTDLTDGGGGCVVTCPDSCTVTSGVILPCSGMPGGIVGVDGYRKHIEGRMAEAMKEGALRRVVDGNGKDDDDVGGFDDDDDDDDDDGGFDGTSITVGTTSITIGTAEQKCQVDGKDVPCDLFISAGGSRLVSAVSMALSLVTVAFAFAFAN